jgi:enamine deaminase RidA (YjgF/YER057c/UK114 family)
MPLERIQPQGLTTWPRLPPVIRAGDLVFLAGQTALDEHGQVVDCGDIVAQVTQVFENLKTALAAAGGDFSQLARIAVYLTDASFRQTIVDVAGSYFPSQARPTSSFVVVAGLAWPELLVEIDEIAILN